MTTSLIDQAPIEELRSLTEDNPGFLPDIIRQFLDEDAPQRLEALRDAIDQGDLMQCGREAHGLKNSCSVVGARLMGALCQAIEKDSRTAERAHIASLIEELERSFAVTAVELRAIADDETET